MEVPSDHPLSLAALATATLGVSTALAGMADGDAALNSPKSSCRKGCGACCRQFVPVSPAEAWMIAELVDRLPGPRRTQIRGKFEEIEKHLDEIGFVDRVLQMQEAGRTAKELRELNHDYFALGIACPFLENESCGIYTDRPSICREYAVTSPPELCSNPFENPVEVVPVPFHLTEALSRLCAQLLGGEAAVIPLSLSLWWAERTQWQRSREWNGQELASQLEKLIHEISRGEPPENP